MKNRVLSIVLAVLTVLSVIPFTMLTTDASIPAHYARTNGVGTAFEGWHSNGTIADTGKIHGYSIQTTTFDGKNVTKIMIDPATVDETTKKVYGTVNSDPTDPKVRTFGLNQSAVNLYRYNQSESYKDIDTQQYMKLPDSADAPFYVMVEYYYQPADTSVEGDPGSSLTGAKMQWNFLNGYDANSAASEGMVAGQWGTQIFTFQTGNAAGKTLGQNVGQMKLYPFYSLGANGQMKQGDVLYIGDVIITDTLGDDGKPAKPTDTVQVDFYISDEAFNDGESIESLSREYNVLVTITMPTPTAPEGKGRFLYWKNLDEGRSLQLAAGAKHVLNFAPNEEFVAVFAETQTRTFEGIATPDTNCETGVAKALPTAQDTPAEGKKLIGWKDSDGTTYALGASYTSTETAVEFTAVYALPHTATFETVINAYTGDEITVPGAPTTPPEGTEGKVFIGWKTGETVYKAGAKFTMPDSDVTFTPVYSEPKTVYLVADSTVTLPDGATAKNSLADADAYIASNGGAGTIIVVGKYNTPAGGHTFQSTNLTIKGYDATAAFMFNGAGGGNNARYIGNGTLKFESIIIRRADAGSQDNATAADEVFNWFPGFDVTFDSTCTFEQASIWRMAGGKPVNNTDINLYIGEPWGGTLRDTKLTFNSSALVVSQFGTLTCWGGGGRTLNQNTEVVINAGTFNAAKMLVFNGNRDAKSDIINGNVTWTINGGKVSAISLGDLATDLNGTAKLTVNGGEVGNLTFGMNSNNGGSAQTADNLIYVINTKAIKNSGKNVPEVLANAGDKQSITTGVSILNNAELVDDASKHIAPNANYRLAVMNGSADANVDANGNLKFTFTPDDTFADGYDVYVGSTKAVKGTDGKYTVTASADLRNVQFVEEGKTLQTITYKNGETTLSTELVPSGTIITLKVISGITAPEGQALKGYTDGTNHYALGETLTVPEADVTLTAEFEEFDGKTYYVSEGGSDDNPGHKKQPAYAFETIVKAINAIGNGTGEIIVTGNTKWGTASTGDAWEAAEVVTVNGNVTITFEDGATVKRTSRDSCIRYEGTGTLKLVNISEIYQEGGHATHDHKVIPAVSNFILEGDYNIKRAGGSWSHPHICPIAFPADKKVNLTLNGKTGWFAFFDWGTTRVDGTIFLNLGSKYESSFIIGGDNGGGTVGTTITGPLFITATDNQKSINIRKGGSGTVSAPTIVINGLQVLNIRSNLTVAAEQNCGTFTNNGGEYIINVPATYDGITVASKELGKLSLTLPEGVTATLTNGENVTTADKSGDYALTAGTTNVVFNISALEVPVKIDGTESSTLKANKGGTFVLPDAPTGEAATAKTVGYVYDGKSYACGATINVPEDATGVALTSIKVDMTAPVIYVDNTNGSDTNLGFVADKPVKNFAQVTELIKGLDSTAVVTVKVIGEYNSEHATGNITLPTHSGKIVVEGDSNGKITYGEALILKSDVEFKNIAFNSIVASKQIDCYGHNVTFGEGVVTTGSAQSVSVHVGIGGADYTGNEKIVINSGNFSTIFLGVYYISCSEEDKYNYDNPLMTWTGDIEMEVNGGTIGSIKFGDGYEWPTGNYVFGTFAIDGNVDIAINGGTVGRINRTFLASADAINVTAAIPYAGADEIKDMDNATVRYYNGVTFDADGKLAEKAYNPITKTNYAVGDELPAGSIVLAKGQYIGDVTVGETTTSKLPVIGAQVRLNSSHALRYVAEISKTTLAEYGYDATTTDGYGFFVLPTNVLQNAPLNAGVSYTFEGKTYTAQKVPAVKKFAITDTTVQYTVALTNIPEDKENLTREYTVVPYVEKDGAYIYGESYSTSLYAVAKYALELDALEASDPNHVALSEESRTRLQAIVDLCK